MKKTLILFVVAILALGSNAFAQKAVKLAHINSADLFQIMPGRDTALAILEKEQASLEEEAKIMQQELEKKYNEYQEKQGSWTELIRNTKQKELQDLNTRIQGFFSQGQQQLQERQEELLKPLRERFQKAIEDVAKENGYTYVFDSGIGSPLLYSQESDDIMPLVKKKLGLK